jgi:hypothetical protein
LSFPLKCCVKWRFSHPLSVRLVRTSVSCVSYCVALSGLSARTSWSTEIRVGLTNLMTENPVLSDHHDMFLSPFDNRYP